MADVSRYFSKSVTSPDGEWLATCRGGSLKVWDSAGDLAREIKAKIGPNILSVDWTGDGQRLILGGDRGVEVRDVNGDLVRFVPQSILQSHRHVNWQPQGDRFVTDGGSVILWSADGRPIATVEEHGRAAWRSDGRQFATTHDGSTFFFTSDGERQSNVLRAETRHDSLSWQPGGEWLAFGGEDGDALLLKCSGETGPALEGKDTGYTKVAWSPDGNSLATGAGNSVKIWNEKGELISTLDVTSCKAFDWSPDGKWLAVIGSRLNLA